MTTSYPYKRFRFDFKSAYGQLILLIFMPVCILTLVGGGMVVYESYRGAAANQKAEAQIVLSRYRPIAKTLLPLLEDKDRMLQAQNIMQAILAESNLNRAAIVDVNGIPLVKVGRFATQPWPQFDSARPLIPRTNGVTGSVYGTRVGLTTEGPVWLLIELNDMPLLMSQYKVWLIVVVTALLTILLLLLSLSIYSKRWIRPIYDMRLHLRKTNSENLYMPMQVNSTGELNLLQRDLIHTLRKLHTYIQELKEHAKQTEDDLRRAFDEMEIQAISTRSAKNVAVNANKAKSAFLANISHELRTPLNSIDGFSNLLAKKANLSHEHNMYVQTIRKSSAHLLALVNDVLDFSKIEAGKLVLDQHEFDLYAAIYDVVDMLSPMAVEKGLKMAVFFYNDVPNYIHADELRIKQILTNLVSNALRFTDAGEVIVRVCLDEDDESYPPKIGFYVQDTGKGVSKAVQKNLFKSFSQGDPSITRQYGGTGLGLVISKQLTELMGGTIGYKDNTKQGSTFWFSLPVMAVEQGINQSTDLESDTTAGKLSTIYADIDIPSQRILVWLNHEASVTVLESILAPYPVEITVAQTLPDLLELLSEEGQHWHWVIVDSEARADFSALLKQIRTNYQGRLAVFGYQVALDTDMLARYRAKPLYEPIDRRQIFSLLSKQQPQAKQIATSKLLWRDVQILAVDDHHPNLLVLEALLKEYGIQPVLAHSGQEALDIISQYHHQDRLFDLIFMDIQMPNMSGLEASEHIRKLESNQDSTNNTPIIALTAHALSSERDQLLAAGIDDYVSKPINEQQLVQLLKRWLDKKKSNLPDDIEFLHSVPMDTVDNAMPSSIERSSTEQVSTVINPEDAQRDNHIIDWDEAVLRAAGKPKLAADLILMLIDSLDSERKALTAAWQDKDLETLTQIAHRLVGGCRYTGTPALQAAVEALDVACQNYKRDKKTLDNANVRLDLADKFDKVIEQINTLKHMDFSPWPQLYYQRIKDNDMTWKML